ncbi:hypothetical protein NHX12_025243 [Muraenolepis orangiensis]|uniref:Uncharacterized protein n=1 Tax=Muraenolepis orangiensis TaxID=630683 RepID=A0A9Q0EMG4_9TELE|nr:hypothetical protein NHX12_025243 [Muraenolepis orangiensis]
MGGLERSDGSLPSPAREAGDPGPRQSLCHSREEAASPTHLQLSGEITGPLVHSEDRDSTVKKMKPSEDEDPSSSSSSDWEVHVAMSAAGEGRPLRNPALCSSRGALCQSHGGLLFCRFRRNYKKKLQSLHLPHQRF